METDVKLFLIPNTPKQGWGLIVGRGDGIISRDTSLNQVRQAAAQTAPSMLDSGASLLQL